MLDNGHCCWHYRNASNLDLTHKATTHADNVLVESYHIKNERKKERKGIGTFKWLTILAKDGFLVVFVPKLFFNSIFHGWPLDPRTHNSLISLYIRNDVLEDGRTF